LKDKINILLKGYYDFFNFGDDLLLLANIELLEKDLGLTPDKVNLYYEKQKDSLPYLKYYKQLNLKDFEEPIKKSVKKNKKTKKAGKFTALKTLFYFFFAFINALIYRIFKKPLFHKQTVEFIKDLDVIHYVGGGYFTTIWEFSLQYLVYEYLFISLARFINPKIKIIGTGLGIGPIESRLYEFVFTLFINQFNYVFTRDDVSYETVRFMSENVNLTSISDDAMMLLPIFKSSERKVRENIFAINLKFDKQHEYGGVKNSIQNLIIFLHSLGYKVEFFSFGLDHHALAEFDRGLVENLTIHNPYEEGFLPFLQNLSKAKVGLGFAYHFSVLCSIFNIPSVCVFSDEYYSQKIEGVTLKITPGQKIVHADDLAFMSPQEILKGLDVLKENYREEIYLDMKHEYIAAYKDMLKL